MREAVCHSPLFFPVWNFFFFPENVFFFSLGIFSASPKLSVHEDRNSENVNKTCKLVC